MIKKSALIQLLRHHHLHLSKRLGQNYLIEVYPIEEMIHRMDVSKADGIVEIGAGLGSITERLAALNLPVKALEVDSAIVKLLQGRMQDTENVEVIHQDVLKFDWTEFERPMVVGAIPYHITSDILLMLTKHEERIQGIWLIVQKEVGMRLSARPSTKEYSRLSVLVQYFWEVKMHFDIPSTAFYPKPNVNSACVSLLPRTRLMKVDDESLFFDLVKIAFSQRRKTLVNCLKAVDQSPWPEPDEWRSFLGEMGIQEQARGESLSLQQFGELSNKLAHFLKKASA